MNKYVSKKEITKMIIDISKLITIIIVIQLARYTIDNSNTLFDEKTLKITLYIAIGLIIFNLFIKKIILSAL